MTVICGQMGGCYVGGWCIRGISIILKKVHALRLIAVDAQVLRRIKLWRFSFVMGHNLKHIFRLAFVNFFRHVTSSYVEVSLETVYNILMH